MKLKRRDRTQAKQETKPKQHTHGIACRPELWKLIQDYAASLEDRSTNWVVCRAIEDYLNRRDPAWIAEHTQAPKV
jgi:hypothetical protein